VASARSYNCHEIRHDDDTRVADAEDVEHVGRDSGQTPVDPEQVITDVQEATERVRRQVWKIRGNAPDEGAEPPADN
jgi:hypothetical protein